MPRKTPLEIFKAVAKRISEDYYSLFQQSPLATEQYINAILAVVKENYPKVYDEIKLSGDTSPKMLDEIFSQHEINKSDIGAILARERPDTYTYFETLFNIYAERMSDDTFREKNQLHLIVHCVIDEIVNNLIELTKETPQTQIIHYPYSIQSIVAANITGIADTDQMICLALLSLRRWISAKHTLEIFSLCHQFVDISESDENCVDTLEHFIVLDRPRYTEIKYSLDDAASNDLLVCSPSLGFAGSFADYCRLDAVKKYFKAPYNYKILRIEDSIFSPENISETRKKITRLTRLIQRELRHQLNRPSSQLLLHGNFTQAELDFLYGDTPTDTQTDEDRYSFFSDMRKEGVGLHAYPMTTSSTKTRANDKENIEPLSAQAQVSEKHNPQRMITKRLCGVFEKLLENRIKLRYPDLSWRVKIDVKNDVDQAWLEADEASARDIIAHFNAPANSLDCKLMRNKKNGNSVVLIENFSDKTSLLKAIPPLEASAQDVISCSSNPSK